MKIWLTTGPITTDTAKRLETRWFKVAPDAMFIRSLEHETHGELLTRLWEEIRTDDDPIQVISELDFIPYDDFQIEMLSLLSQSPALFCEYVTRDPDLTLRRHGPTSAAWLLGLNR